MGAGYNLKLSSGHFVAYKSLLLALFTLVLFGCGGEKAASESVKSTEPPKAAEKFSPILKLSAGDNMMFDKTLLLAEAGSNIRIELTHTGRMPMNTMAHNVVVLEIGIDPFDVALAASMAKDSAYIPKDYSKEIIAYTELVGPGKAVSADFTAPEVPGDYPFLCTFPGHFQGGMTGILRIVAPNQ